MLGRWIVDLNLKLQNRIAKLKADEDKWKQNVREQFEEDVAMQLEEPTTEEFFATESQIAKVLSKKPKSMYEKRWVQEEQPVSEEKKADPHFQTLAELKKQEAQRRKDDQCVIDGLYMDENDIESAYKGDQ